MISDQKVKGPGTMIDFIKKDPAWMRLFCFWMVCGALALGAVFLKTRGPWFAGQNNDVDAAYAIKELNFYMPDSYADMANALTSGQPVPPDYLKYYERAAEFLPKDFAGHYLLGLCRYSVGRQEQAAESLRRAIDADPYFFWAYYDLGMVYWHNGQKEDARRIWALGARIRPQLVLKSLVSTKLLTDLLGDAAFAGYDTVGSLRKGYEQASLWAQGQEGPEHARPVLF